jgi:MoaA/NifB/PqqE/SkfB family radical SAM enzyme
MTTMLVTNGSLLTEEWLTRMRPYLDWMTFSIDASRDEVCHYNLKLSLNLFIVIPSGVNTSKAH